MLYFSVLVDKIAIEGLLSPNTNTMIEKVIKHKPINIFFQSAPLPQDHCG